jgi:hypothetical protein
VDSGSVWARVIGSGGAAVRSVGLLTVAVAGTWLPLVRCAARWGVLWSCLRHHPRSAGGWHGAVRPRSEASASHAASGGARLRISWSRNP